MTNRCGLNLAIIVADRDKRFPVDAPAQDRLSARGIAVGLARLTHLLSVRSTQSSSKILAMSSGHWQKDCT
jgi:hypothetical protein